MRLTSLGEKDVCTTLDYARAFEVWWPIEQSEAKELTTSLEAGY